LAALDRAITFEQVNHVAKAVAEDLRFDVLWITIYHFFQKTSAETKTPWSLRKSPRRSFCPALRCGVAATNTGGRHHRRWPWHHRVTDAVAFDHASAIVRDVAFGARVTGIAALIMLCGALQSCRPSAESLLPTDL